MSDAVAMTVEEALTHSDEWTKGQTFYPGAQGWRVVCAVLAAEVRRLRDHMPAGTKMVEPANKPLLLKIWDALNEECAGKCNAEYNPCWSRQLIGEIDNELQKAQPAPVECQPVEYEIVEWQKDETSSFSITVNGRNNQKATR